MRYSKVEAQTPKNGKSNGTVVGEGVIIADMQFKVIALNEAAQSILRSFNGGGTDSPEGLPGLPEEIVKLLSEYPKEGPEAIFLPLNGHNGEYSCRAFVLKPAELSGNPPIFTLYIKREVSVTDAVHQVGLYYNLTHREQEALIGVSMGLTSKQLAKRMKISPNTVKAFLRLIMIKMGAATRAGVVGKLLEQNGYSQKPTYPLDRQQQVDREA